MRFLGRNRRSSDESWAARAPAAGDLWAWWATARDEVATAIGEGGVPASLVDGLGSRIQAIHPDLEWELSKGRSSQHALVISAGGVAGMRATAERVIRAAPAADATWEYASSRQADPGVETAGLQFDGVPVELGSTRFVASRDEDRAELDVLVYQPAFLALGESSLHVAFLILDWTLGEDAVERWVGSIDVVAEEPEQHESLTMAGLRNAVDELASSTEPFWVILEDGERGRVVVVRRPLKQAEFPIFDLRLDVSVELDSSDSLGRAQALEDVVSELLGDDGLHAASVTEGGRQRTSHFYCDSETVSAEEVEAGARAATTDVFGFEATLDPGWDAVRPYR